MDPNSLYLINLLLESKQRLNTRLNGHVELGAFLINFFHVVVNIIFRSFQSFSATDKKLPIKFNFSRIRKC